MKIPLAVTVGRVFRQKQSAVVPLVPHDVFNSVERSSSVISVDAEKT